MQKILNMITAAFMAAGALTNQAMSDVTLTTANGVLLDHGRPIRLVGYGDPGILSDRRFDYAKFFDEQLVPNRVNFLRVWVCYHFADDLTPFRGDRASGYDLETKSGALYDRLADLVAAANRRNIVVQVTLFDGVAFDTGALDPHDNRWRNNPYNDRRNRQSYLNTPRQFDEVNSACWSRVNVPLIREVADRLGASGNVIYEVLNEPNVHGGAPDNLTFQQSVVSVLWDRLQGRAGSKVISINLPRANADRGTRAWALSDRRIGMVSYHGSANDRPDAIAASEAWSTIRKPIILSTDGHNLQFKDNYASQASTRAAAASAFCSNLFGLEDRAGHVHVECLDKDLNGDRSVNWQDYTPLAARGDIRFLQALRRFR